MCPDCLAEYSSNQRFCHVDGMLLVTQTDLVPGTVFRDTYRIVRIIGRGGMGVVYLAEHVLLGQPRALKFLSSELAADPSAIKRFLREARRASEIGLDNQHIVKTLDVGQDDEGRLFLCMEYVEGPSLAALLGEFPNGLPLNRTFVIARCVLLGLEAAHARGMVHRDIKPGNILLTRESNENEEIAKIADFGIVSGTDTEANLTLTGIQPLTPGYASPEQWLGSVQGHSLDARTDLYAFGCVLFEMLTGKPPFRGTNAEQLREQHLNEPAPVASSLRTEVGNFPGLDQLLVQLLKKDRTERPETAQAALGTLKGIFQAPSSVNTPEPFRNKLTFHRRRSGLFGKLLAGLAALALISICVLFLMHWLEVNGLPWESTTEVAAKARSLYRVARFKEAIPLFKKACDGGDLESCDGLGATFDAAPNEDPLGLGLAFGFYRRACNGGYMLGCQHAGDSFFDASGTKQDPMHGLFYYNKACDKGLASSCDKLGGVYSAEGTGVPMDFGRAAVYFRRGCDGDYGISCIRLGSLYADGKGVPKDGEQARYLTEKGCKLAKTWCGSAPTTPSKK